MGKLNFNVEWLWGVVGGILPLVLMGAFASVKSLAGVLLFMLGPFLFLISLLSHLCHGEGPLFNILFLILFFLYYGFLSYLLIHWFKNKKWKWLIAILVGYLALHTATILWLFHVMSGLRGL